MGKEFKGVEKENELESERKNFYTNSKRIINREHPSLSPSFF
jgi:hypothetical protein